MLLPAPIERSFTLPKLSKDAVDYRCRGIRANLRCGTCRAFAPPVACLSVEGQISAQGVCDLVVER